MAATRDKTRFGLPSSVGDTMDILKVLAKNDESAITRFWKTSASNAQSQKASLFHTLAIMDMPRLVRWVQSTPQAWWGVSASEGKRALSKEDVSIASRYQDLAGGMLHYLYKEANDKFMALLTQMPMLFQASSCRYYVAEWCQGLSVEQLSIFQPILSKMPAVWYTSEPQRVHFLTSLAGNERLMLEAAVANKGVVHSLLEKKYPGLDVCVQMASSMMADTKQKKAYVRQWIVQQMGPAVEQQHIELPDFDSSV